VFIEKLILILFGPEAGTFSIYTPIKLKFNAKNNILFALIFGGIITANAIDLPFALYLTQVYWFIGALSVSS